MGFHKLFGSDPFVFTEGLDEIAFIIKATGDGYLLYGDILCGQHFTGTFYTIVYI